jgi:hypothetical protein
VKSVRSKSISLEQPFNPDLSVGQAIQELKEVKNTIKNIFCLAPPAAKVSKLVFDVNLHYRLSTLETE